MKDFFFVMNCKLDKHFRPTGCLKNPNLKIIRSFGCHKNTTPMKNSSFLHGAAEVSCDDQMTQNKRLKRQ